jgi:hypothetical protein
LSHPPRRVATDDSDFFRRLEMDGMAFEALLAWMEERGWELTRIWKPYRVFNKPGHLPILVEVHPGGKVVKADVEQVKRTVEQADRRSQGRGD